VNDLIDSLSIAHDFLMEVSLMLVFSSLLAEKSVP
jgi:hypothetical protein